MLLRFRKEQGLGHNRRAQRERIRSSRAIADAAGPLAEGQLVMLFNWDVAANLATLFTRERGEAEENRFIPI